MVIDKKRFLALTALLSSSALLMSERTHASPTDEGTSPPTMSKKAVGECMSKCQVICDLVKRACDKACKGAEACSQGEAGTCDQRKAICSEQHCPMLCDPATELSH